jgi:hypothetical protein
VKKDSQRQQKTNQYKQNYEATFCPLITVHARLIFARDYNHDFTFDFLRLEMT